MDLETYKQKTETVNFESYKDCELMYTALLCGGELSFADKEKTQPIVVAQKQHEQMFEKYLGLEPRCGVDVFFTKGEAEASVPAELLHVVIGAKIPSENGDVEVFLPIAGCYDDEVYNA